MFGERLIYCCFFKAMRHLVFVNAGRLTPARAGPQPGGWGGVGAAGAAGDKLPLRNGLTEAFGSTIPVFVPVNGIVAIVKILYLVRHRKNLYIHHHHS